MKFSSLNILSAAAILAIASAIAGCGGGGSDSNGGGKTPAEPLATDVVPTTGTIQASAGTSTYTTASREADAFAALNLVRTSGGFGAVIQASAIDTAASRHAAYLLVNGAKTGLVPIEDGFMSNFFAVDPWERISRSGFPVNLAAESIGLAGASRDGGDCIRGLLKTPHQAALLLTPVTHVGVSFGTDPSGMPMCVVDLAQIASAPLAQVMPAGKVAVYPYDGQTDVLGTSNPDAEVPGLPNGQAPIAKGGTPVVVSIRNADYVNLNAAGSLGPTVSKFEIRDASGALVPSSVWAESLIWDAGVTVIHDSALLAGMMMLVPNVPLARNTLYTVSLRVTLATGASPLTKTWTFKTEG